MWLIFICMTWIFCEKIVPSLLFPAAVRPQTFWYSPGRVATAYSTDKYKYKISWVGQSTTPKGPVLAQKGPFGGPRGPRRAPGDLLLAQLPLADPSGWAVSISCAPASSKTSTALLGPPKGHRFGQKIPFGGPWGSPDIPYNPNGVPISQMPPIHQLPAVWNVICAYRDILSLHFSRKGPKRAILPWLLKFCGPILGQNCFQSEYRRVGCPDHRNGTPCSYIAITANLEPPSSRKWSKTG